jgi:hypothetical protein
MNTFARQSFRIKPPPALVFAVAVIVYAVAAAQPVNKASSANTAPSNETSPPKPFAVQPPKTPTLKALNLDPPLTSVNSVLDPLPSDAPRAPTDPKNLEGLWMYGHPFYGHIQRTIYGTPVPITDAGAKVLTERVEADNAGRPVGNQTSGCRPAGPFHWYRLHFPIVILQGKDFIYLLSEQYHGLWEVRMNQKHRSGRYNSGDSIGHWDGDTLVIETTQFSEPLWLDMAGSPLSTDTRMTYRLRKIDDGQSLEIVTSVYDPIYYSQEWSFANRLVWRPDRFLGEYNCELQLKNGGEQALGSFRP